MESGFHGSLQVMVTLPEGQTTWPDNATCVTHSHLVVGLDDDEEIQAFAEPFGNYRLDPGKFGFSSSVGLIEIGSFSSIFGA